MQHWNLKSCCFIANAITEKVFFYFFSLSSKYIIARIKVESKCVWNEKHSLKLASILVYFGWLNLMERWKKLHGIKSISSDVWFVQGRWNGLQYRLHKVWKLMAIFTGYGQCMPLLFWQPNHTSYIISFLCMCWISMFKDISQYYNKVL